jgi:amino acid adenylation domain-containing protein
VNAPKGVLTESLRAQIAECKPELLNFLRDYDQSVASIPPPILRRPAGSPAPLSFAQERLWFLDQLEPGRAVYNICRASRLSGNLHLTALEASLNEIVRRHEVLRSVIRVADGQQVQVAEPPYALKLSVVDLPAMSDTDREPEIRRRIQQAAEAPFDFSAGKIFRAALLRLGNDEHILILTTHHIVCDAWSMGILAHELWPLYEAFAMNKPSPLKALPIQYADFAVWQREWLQGDVLEPQLSYWKKQLDELPVLALPTDRPRPARQSFNGARVPITLPESLTVAINDLGQREGVTPFMLLLAAFQVLLYRYSGQEDVVLGSPIANRNRTELEPLIGFFVNTLVLRSDLSGNPTFKELLSRVHDVCLGAYGHQDLPFEKLVQELQPERDQSRNPLFQVMFVLQNATRPFNGNSGLQIGPSETETTRSPFDLSHFLRERDGKYIGYIEYSTDLFNRDRIERMARHFQSLLEGIIANPEQPISTLPILTDSERHQILIEWNDNATDYPSDQCIHQLFEEQAERTPDRIAVEFDGQSITYRGLNARANKLANYLINLGVEPEKLVGICVDRSREMVVGLLGILKAGRAYVPLDPSYPRERLEFMLQDAQISVLLTKRTLIEDGRWRPVLSQAKRIEDSKSQPSVLDSRLKVVCLDRDWPVIEKNSAENSQVKTNCDNLAFIIYTSGSTGQPKGVQVSHRSVVNCLVSIGRRVGMTGQDRLLAVTTISFDISALELFLPLLVGGTVVLVSREEATDGTELARRVKEFSATVVQGTPSTWRMLINAGWEGSAEFKILCGGESLSRDLAQILLTRGEVWNLYGPTETTIWSTIHKVKSAEGPVSIGRPIANTQIYIIDSHLQPAPIGVYGELCIGGDGLARGYLNNPVLTSERFIRNPFSDDPDARLYRTGDRVRFRPDGNIEFLGRTDRQVKIRGYRIELGEIGAVLNQHPAVRESVILARNGDSLQEDSLVGYVVPKQRLASSGSELREYLKDKLPDYMVPSIFIPMEEFPLTANGKIDRSKLPAPNPPSNEAIVSPRTEIEDLMAQVWRDVLKVNAIGVHDNFFELGGHSLLAIQIISRVRDTFDKEIALSAIFDAPTIAGFAATIEKAINGRPHDFARITRARRDGPLPLSMNQEHLWRLDRLIPGSYFFNMPYVYRLTGDLNVAALKQALHEIIRRHEALRTVFAECNGRPVQVIKKASQFQLPLVDLRGESADKVSQKAARLMLEERGGTFDLTSGPLVRIKLLRLTNTENLLLVTMHHIISDHWSMGIFVNELITLYGCYYQKRQPLLPDPPFHFADYAFWERSMLDDGRFHPHQSFWKKQLTEPLTNLEFARNRKVKDGRYFYMCEESIDFDDDLLRKIKRLCFAEGYTPFMVLIAGLSVLVHLWTSQRDIRVGILVANRVEKGTEGVIGYLANTIVLRFKLSPQTLLKEFLNQVRNVTLMALFNQQLPFEVLAQTLESEHNSKRSTIFDVLLMYQHGSPMPHDAVGLTFASMDLKRDKLTPEPSMTTYPLILKLRETSTKLTGTVNYRVDSFDPSDMLRLKTGLEGVLRRMVSQGRNELNSVRVSSLDFLI